MPNISTPTKTKILYFGLGVATAILLFTLLGFLHFDVQYQFNV